MNVTWTRAEEEANVQLQDPVTDVTVVELFHSIVLEMLCNINVA